MERVIAELQLLIVELGTASSAAYDGDLDGVETAIRNADDYAQTLLDCVLNMDPPKPTGEPKKSRRQPTPNGDSHDHRNKN